MNKAVLPGKHMRPFHPFFDELVDTDPAFLPPSVMAVYLKMDQGVLKYLRKGMIGFFSFVDISDFIIMKAI